jgi:hypothetical protein
MDLYIFMRMDLCGCFKKLYRFWQMVVNAYIFLNAGSLLCPDAKTATEATAEEIEKNYKKGISAAWTSTTTQKLPKKNKLVYKIDQKLKHLSFAKRKAGSFSFFPYKINILDIQQEM